MRTVGLFSLFVAVLVDNFQLTLEAANELKKAKKKVIVDSDDEEDYLEVSDSGQNQPHGLFLFSVQRPRIKFVLIFHSGTLDISDTDIFKVNGQNSNISFIRFG